MGWKSKQKAWASGNHRGARPAIHPDRVAAAGPGSCDRSRRSQSSFSGGCSGRRTSPVPHRNGSHRGGCAVLCRGVSGPKGSAGRPPRVPCGSPDSQPDRPGCRNGAEPVRAGTETYRPGVSAAAGRGPNGAAGGRRWRVGPAAALRLARAVGAAPNGARQQGGNLVGLTLGAEGTHQGAHGVIVQAELRGDGGERALLQQMGAEDFLALVQDLRRFGEEALAPRLSHDRDSPGALWDRASSWGYLRTAGRRGKGHGPQGDGAANGREMRPAPRHRPRTADDDSCS